MATSSGIWGGTRGSRRPNLEPLPRTPKIEFAPNVRAVNTAQLAAMSITYRAFICYTKSSQLAANTILQPQGIELIFIEVILADFIMMP